jgi:hypothetical protein
MAWDWQPIETAPRNRFVLIAICKGTLRCPIRSDRYVAQAILMPNDKWRVFGQGDVRDDEVVTHWIEPELPEGYPEDADNQGLADQMKDWNFTPPTKLDEPNTPVPAAPDDAAAQTPAEPLPADDAVPPPLANQLEPPPPLKNELEP